MTHTKSHTAKQIKKSKQVSYKAGGTAKNAQESKAKLMLRLTEETSFETVSDEKSTETPPKQVEYASLVQSISPPEAINQEDRAKFLNGLRSMLGLPCRPGAAPQARSLAAGLPPVEPLAPLERGLPTVETPFVLVPDYNKVLNGDTDAGMKYVSRQPVNQEAFKQKLDGIGPDAEILKWKLQMMKNFHGTLQKMS